MCICIVSRLHLNQSRFSYPKDKAVYAYYLRVYEACIYDWFYSWRFLHAICTVIRFWNFKVYFDQCQNKWYLDHGVLRQPEVCYIAPVFLYFLLKEMFALFFMIYLLIDWSYICFWTEVHAYTSSEIVLIICFCLLYACKMHGFWVMFRRDALTNCRLIRRWL